MATWLIIAENLFCVIKQIITVIFKKEGQQYTSTWIQYRASYSAFSVSWFLPLPCTMFNYWGSLSAKGIICLPHLTLTIALTCGVILNWTLCLLFFFNFINLFTYFIYFWLHWVFVAAHWLSLVAASGGYSSLQCVGFSLQWLLLLRSTGSRCAGFSSCGSRALECRLGSCGTQA